MGMDGFFIENVGKEANYTGRRIIVNKSMKVRMATISY